jgi:NAD+ kinase
MITDYMITVGGDGTILRATMMMRNPETPIIGVNMGSRGFLTEVNPTELKDKLDRVLDGDYEIEECIKLSSSSNSIEGQFPDAINEVLIASSMPSKTLDFTIYVDGYHLLDVQADGIIIAPPTGSTAYNLSAGGSILAPNVDAMIITAICPYSYFKSIVVPSSSKIEIELLKKGVDGLVIIDGREYTGLKPHSKVNVWRSKYRSKFVRFKPFYHRLERRLIFKSLK